MNQLTLEIDTEQSKARLERKIIIAHEWIAIARKKLEALNASN